MRVFRVCQKRGGGAASLDFIQFSLGCSRQINGPKCEEI